MGVVYRYTQYTLYNESESAMEARFLAFYRGFLQI